MSNLFLLPCLLRRRLRLAHRVFVPLAFVGGVGLQAADPAEPASAGADIAALRETMDKWVDMQKAIAKEKSDAKEAVKLLEQRIVLVTQELEEVRKKKIENEKQITDADKKKAEMVKKKDLNLASLKNLDDELPKMEAQLRALKPLLPAMIQDKFEEKLFSRLPEPGQPTKLVLAERYITVVGILNELNKANLEINLIDETRTLDDGKTSAVKALYVGLAQAYFVNATGKKAGVGRPGPQGWVWTQDDSLAGTVRNAIGMLQSKSAAKFVAVPLKVD